MGVRVLARSTSTPLATLEARVAQLGGVGAVGRWRTQCSYLLPRAGDAGLHDLFVFSYESSAADPDSGGGGGGGGNEVCLVSQDAGTTGGVRVLRAGRGMFTILEQMNTHAQRLRVSIEGGEHHCGDFIVRVGQLVLNTTLAGAVLEIEYTPCTLASMASEAQPLHALLELLLPRDESDFCSNATECFHLARDLPETFGDEHGALLMVALMRERLLTKGAAR